MALVNTNGQSIGTVRAWQTTGGVTFRIDAARLPHGVHGLHVHAVGRCDPPDFQTARPALEPGQPQARPQQSRRPPRRRPAQRHRRGQRGDRRSGHPVRHQPDRAGRLAWSDPRRRRRSARAACPGRRQCHRPERQQRRPDRLRRAPADAGTSLTVVQGAQRLQQAGRLLVQRAWLKSNPCITSRATSRAADGAVEVDGPDAVDVAMTPEAAEETSERLLRQSFKARGQKRLDRLPHRPDE